MPTLTSRFRTFAGRLIPAIRPMKEQGTTGTSVYGGYVQNADRSPDWNGRQKYITSAELATNVSIVAAGTHYFLNMVAHPQWTCSPSDPDNEASVRAAKFAENLINDTATPWNRIIRKAAIYRFYGFGIQEWIAKSRGDGLIGIKDVESRPQHTIERWEISDTGKILGVWQRSPQTGALLGLPRQKFLYMVDDTLTDSPEGIGMFRHLAEPYARLKRYLELEVQAYERDLRGIPVGRVPLTKLNEAIRNNVITKAQADAMIASMENMVQIQTKSNNTGMILDSMPYENMTATGPAVSSALQWSLDLLQGGGSAFAEINTVIDRTQREMARIIGVEHLMMGDQGGNRALALDKSRNLYLIANSILDNIAVQVRSDVLWPIWMLNGFPEHLLPHLETEDVAFKDVEQISATLTRMAQSGAVLAPDDPVINEVRGLLGVSDQTDPMGAMDEPFTEEDQLPDDPLQALMSQMMGNVVSQSAEGASEKRIVRKRLKR